MKTHNNIDLEITVGNDSHAEDITRFQMDMAMESEGLALDHERISQGVKAVLADEAKGQYIVASINGVTVGCLMITREWSDWNNCWYWWIQSVYVSPHHRSQGIYTAMYHTVLNLAKANGVSQIRLYVDKNNLKAQRTYQRLGMDECHYYMYETTL